MSMSVAQNLKLDVWKDVPHKRPRVASSSVFFIMRMNFGQRVLKMAKEARALLVLLAKVLGAVGLVLGVCLLERVQLNQPLPDL